MTSGSSNDWLGFQSTMGRVIAAFFRCDVLDGFTWDDTNGDGLCVTRVCLQKRHQAVSATHIHCLECPYCIVLKSKRAALESGYVLHNVDFYQN